MAANNRIEFTDNQANVVDSIIRVSAHWTFDKNRELNLANKFDIAKVIRRQLPELSINEVSILMHRCIANIFVDAANNASNEAFRMEKLVTEHADADAKEGFYYYASVRPADADRRDK